MGEERRTYHWGAEPTPNQRRVLVAEAAQALGISEGAVRMRVKRGTLPSAREGGRLYVLLDTEPTPEPERTHDRTDLLIAELQDRVRSLEEANRENRRIIAALTSRIPAIEAPASSPGSEPSEPSSEATEQPGRVGPQTEVEGAQEPREESEMHMPEGRWWSRSP